MRFSSAMIGLVGLLLAQTTHAEQRQEHPCASAQTQMEMGECYDQQARKADAELNAVYQKLMSTIDQSSKEKLKAAEVAWIKFRDVNCTFVAGASEGGSVYPTALSVCITHMTQERTTELREILTERSSQ